MPMSMFPYLAVYKADTVYVGVVILVKEAHHAVVLYVPPTEDLNSELFETHIGDTHSPTNSDIEPFVGTVKLSNAGGSILEMPV